MTEKENAEDIIYWLKDDIKCLYMVSEIKKEFKNLSTEKFIFWNKVHEIVLNHFIKD